MKTYFTADTHFFHTNIIKYCNRPFYNAEHMNATLIANWNERVKPEDEVWHLGNFCFGNRAVAHNVRSQLNGKIHFIWGNHDSSQVREYHGWESSGPYREIKLNGRHIGLFHYACRIWNWSNHDSLMLYGHSHGKLPGNSQSLDVGVDCWDFYPVTLEEILERLKSLPPFRESETK